MKKMMVSLAASLMALTLTVPALAVTPDTARLVADGRDTALDVGAITVAVDGDTISVAYTIDEGASDWRLEETHLYVGDEVPARHSPGQFPYKNEELGGVVSDSYEVAIAAADINGDGIVYVAAHTALVMPDGIDPETGDPVYAYESAWAQVGEDDISIGKGNNWATCFAVDLNQ